MGTHSNHIQTKGNQVIVGEGVDEGKERGFCVENSLGTLESLRKAESELVLEG